MLYLHSVLSITECFHSATINILILGNIPGGFGFHGISTLRHFGQESFFELHPYDLFAYTFINPFTFYMVASFHTFFGKSALNSLVKSQLIFLLSNYTNFSHNILWHIRNRYYYFKCTDKLCFGINRLQRTGIFLVQHDAPVMFHIVRDNGGIWTLRQMVD